MKTTDVEFTEFELECLNEENFKWMRENGYLSPEAESRRLRQRRPKWVPPFTLRHDGKHK